jgi:aerobic carbon-monoxide dehydrogenase medium subunit
MSQPFDYYRPKTRTEALELLSRPRYRTVPLLIHPKPTAPRKMNADAFVDLSLLGMDHVLEAADSSLHVGGLATLQKIIESPLLGYGAFKMLSQAIKQVAGPGLRNVSTVWGAIQAHIGSPEILLALLAIDAQVVLLGAGEQERTISLPEFFSIGSDSLHKNEIVLEVIIPHFAASGWAMERVARTPHDEAIVAAVVAIRVDAGKASCVHIAVGGANPVPLRLSLVESILTGKVFNEQTLQTATDAAMRQAEPVADFRGSAEYRRAMAGLVLRRALEAAWRM